MHERIATLSGSLADMKAGLSGDADRFELRLDALWKTGEESHIADDLLALTETDKPLLATLRPKRQGGAFDGPEELRLNLLAAAARAGCGQIDLEADLPPQAFQALRGEADLLISDHSQPSAPSRDHGLRDLQAMQDRVTVRQKLAYPCGSFLDELRALELAHAHAERRGDPAIAPMGASAAFRALLAIAGNQSTYGHGGVPAFSGQPGLADIDAVWNHWGLRHDELGGRDGWYAVLGNPVQHSLSPRIHNAMLRHHGRTERYGAMLVPDSIGAMRLLAGVATRIGLRGASITMPLKAHAATAFEGDAAVQAIGAANCARFDQADAKPAATNTDATALHRLLAGHDSVAVIGAGGAARAAIWAAQSHGADVQLVARPGPRTDATAQAFGIKATWGQPVEADAWVQATPLGMKGESSPVAPAEAKLAIELVYGEQPTDFENQATRLGADVVSGRQFLIEQALDAYAFWTGREANREVMESA
ncbi:MAG: type I 3-dehydroquinate dehydratase [Thermoplasmatota archaeon]